MLSIFDFVRMYQDKYYDRVHIIFEWEWIDAGIDEEYSFDGIPSEFIEKYTFHYSILDGLDIDDLHLLQINNSAYVKEVYMHLYEY